MPSWSRTGAVVAAVVVAAATAVIATASLASAAGSPAFAQQVAARKANTSTLAVTMPGNTVAGNRLVVETAVWSSGSATVTAVTDNAGDSFVKLLAFTASDHTQLSVWTAPVGTGGTRPVITAKASTTADLGLVALEYSGLSTVGDASVLDTAAQASGSTSGAKTVSSGPTGAVAADGELALGFYADSGFGDSLAAAGGFTLRGGVAPAGDMETLAEDLVVGAGATPAASVASGSSTIWLMATVVLKGGSTAPPTVPAAPTGVAAAPGDGSATVTWTAPANGGSPVTSYTVTPYVAGAAQAPTTVPAPATSVTIPGLSNGTAYTFTVSATNAVGTGPDSAPSGPVTPGPQLMGSWAPLQTWPIVPISNSLLYNGNVVAWDGWQQPQPSVVWNPGAPSTFTTITAPDSVFCDGGATLPDGRLLVVGGYGGLSTGRLGIVDTNIFDPATNTWTRVADMNNPRWYPSLTELADGRYLAVSGNSNSATVWADTPEVYDPSSNTWTLLSGISTPQVREDEYPFSYLLPGGKVFVIGPNEDNSFLLDTGNQTWTPVGGPSGVHNGSSVMYLPGKVLYTGGGVDINNPGPSFNTADTIDLTAASPTWQQIAPMNHARVYHTLTMLPDGTVLAVGGSSNTDQGVVTSGVLPAEIWNPTTGTWTEVAPMASARNYHSTALLMPDGRVLVGGGGHPFGLGDPGQYSTQFYSPPYLSSGPRPTITSAPGGATYGSNIAITTPDAAHITAVNLVSLGADTHQLDMNQHFVPLQFTAGGSTLNVSAPANAALAPPGYYMLFILNDKGVPSVASMVRLNPTSAPPAAPTAVSASAGNATATVAWTAGSDGGSPITSYTVTPYAGGVAQPATTVNGNPAPTHATVTGLTNGVSYTFTVRATNSAGTSTESAASGAVTPTASPPPSLAQKVSGVVADKTGTSVTMPGNTTAGNRLVVEVGAWGSGSPTVSAVSDNAGDAFTRVASFAASDHTQMTVWTAVVATGGTRPVITATTTGTADIGVAALEYAGLSTAAGAAAIDVQAQASGTTSAAATVRSGPTAAVGADNELAIGFYADSGFGTALVGDPQYGTRVNASPNGNMDLLVQDSLVGTGATPNPGTTTGRSTVWLAATIVFRLA